jgi:uncharacterized protein (TIGR02270 family)
MPIPLDIIHEHAHEAAFLWRLRELASTRPNYDLAGIAELDARLEAHLDGLRLAREHGWAQAAALMAEVPSADGLFPAAVLAVESGDPAWLEAIYGAVIGDPPLEAGLISALGWVDGERAAAVTAPLLVAASATMRRIAISALAAHGRNPGAALTAACTQEDGPLRARALRAAGELGRIDLVEICRRAARDADQPCRAAAAQSLALLAGEGLGVLRELADLPGPWQEGALQIAARRIDHAGVVDWINADAERPERSRRAVRLAGMLGDPVAMPWLFAQMRVPSLARVAGASFTLITGLDLAAARMSGTAPEDVVAGPDDDPADPDVDLDPDEHLPWPHAERIEAWWAGHAGAFAVGARHLLGKPIAAAALADVLRTGAQPQRAAAALELSLLEPGRPLFDVRAPALRQLRALG